MELNFLKIYDFVQRLPISDASMKRSELRRGKTLADMGCLAIKKYSYLLFSVFNKSISLSKNLFAVSISSFTRNFV